MPRPPSQPRAALIRDRNLAHEIDVTFAWQVCDLFSLSAVAGVLVLEPGGGDFFADDRVWSHYLLALTSGF